MADSDENEPRIKETNTAHISIDIIAIDFSRKLPFRLKLPMIQAATQRGIYSEITYSHLIGDVNIRRQMLSDAKVDNLVGQTVDTRLKIDNKEKMVP